MRKGFISVLLALRLLGLGVPAAFAAPESGTIRLELIYESGSNKMYIEGIEIELYYSAEAAVLVDTLRSDSEGSIVFSNLPFGSYLLHQKNPEADKYIFADIRIELPFVNADSESDYVIARPKLEKLKPSPAPKPSPKPGGKLPQTGLVQWPIPVLAFGAAASIAAGSILLHRRGRGQ